MNRLAGIIILMFMSFNVLAEGNPGESADDCVEISQEKGSGATQGKFSIKNTCNEHIFVRWCETLSGTQSSDFGVGKNLQCGWKELQATYYKGAIDLDAGKVFSPVWKVYGDFHYGACKGRNDVVAFTDDAEGNYKCKATGDYLKSPLTIIPDTRAADKAARDKAGIEADKINAAKEKADLAERNAERNAVEAKMAADEAKREEKQKKWCMAQPDLSDCACAKYSTVKGTKGIGTACRH